MTSIEYFCDTCNAGPWSQDAIGSNEKLIVQFHIDLGHVLVEYVEPVSKDIFQREIWNDKKRKNFKKLLREEKIKSGKKS